LSIVAVFRRRRAAAFYPPLTVVPMAKLHPASGLYFIERLSQIGRRRVITRWSGLTRNPMRRLPSD